MPTVGNISSPVIAQTGNAPTSGVSDLAQTTKSITHASRITPANKAGEIQQTSREPRTTPPALAQKTTEESRSAHFTPKQDQVNISANARAARSPEPVQTGTTLGGIEVGNTVNIQA
ncbi:MAG: hypothetical protein HQL67_09335 [Magnetococcales bacterium]|nr:hypothetical protein [Magnetococcales bacterium]